MMHLAEREGNEHAFQYVGYQMFDLPVKVEVRITLFANNECNLSLRRYEIKAVPRSSKLEFLPVRSPKFSILYDAGPGRVRFMTTHFRLILRDLCLYREQIQAIKRGTSLKRLSARF